MKNQLRFLLSAATFSLAFFALPVFAAEYHVTTNGSSSGNGGSGSPWSLQYALSGAGGRVQGGDTIWVHGGTYYGHYTSSLQGDSSRQILVRNYNGERATLDGVNDNTQVLLINSSYTTYMGLEIMNSGTDRVAERPGMPDSSGTPNSSWPYPDDMSRGDGVQFSNSSVVPGNKIINMIIHDTRQGVSIWAGATGVELYGNLIYNDGWQSSDRGHGHGVYAQNTSGGARRTLSDNIFWGQFSHGVHVYGSDAAYIDNYSLIGNISFGHQTTERGLLIGGGNVGNNDIFDSNMVYNDQVQLGQYAGLNHATVRNNHIISNTSITAFRFQNTSCGAVESFTGNTIIGNIDTSYCNPANFSGNNINGSPSLRVFVRKNAYEEGRANITVFNPGGGYSVTADVSAVGLANGTYQLHNAENYYGDVVTINYSGGNTISIPMAGHSRVPTIGYNKWSFTTFPYFGSFILTKPGATQSTTPGSCAATNSCSGSPGTVTPTGNAPDGTHTDRCSDSIGITTGQSALYASPCPVVSSLTHASNWNSNILTISLLPQQNLPPNDNNYVWPVVYVTKNAKACTSNCFASCGANETGDHNWCIFPVPVPILPSWNSGTVATRIEINKNNLPKGTHYIASFDWTWNSLLGCYLGPGATACGPNGADGKPTNNSGKWRLQAFTVN